MSRRTLLALTGALALVACKSEAPEKPAKEPAPPAPIDVDDVATCDACHQAVYAEWKQSAHALAHQSKDPIYAAMRNLRIEKQGEGVAKVCAGCHGPRAVDDPEGPVAAHGVTCAGCHAVAAVHPDKKGAAAFTWTSTRTLLGPHEPTEKGALVHGGGPAPEHMKDGSSLCLACHGELEGKHGVPVCSTGPEWQAGAEGGKTCVDCHMPVVEGPSGILTDREQHRSHRFWGPRATWGDSKLDFVASGLDVSAAFAGAKLEVTLVNTSQHALPSGFPGRMLIVAAVGFDAEGKEVWKAEPELLNKVYVDENDKVVLPPFAAKLKRDARLKPNETRKLTFDAPKAVKKAEVRVAYRLMPPPLAKVLKLETSPLAGVKPVTKVAVER